VRQEAIHILYYSLKDNVNAYELQEDGNYIKCKIEEGSEPLNIHQAFYDVTLDQVMATHLFEDEDQPEDTITGDTSVVSEQTSGPADTDPEVEHIEAEK
jgi:polyphosphate kinase